MLTSALPNPFVDNPDPSFLIHGNAVLYSSTLTKTRDEQITLIDNERIATLIEFSEPFNFIIVNTHLDHRVGDVADRQAQQVIDWLQPYNDKPLLVCGDFNKTPDSLAYQYFSREFNSAMKTFKGSEPIITYPTGLRSGYRMDEDAGCLDYIWFKNLNLEYAEVVTHN